MGAEMVRHPDDGMGLAEAIAAYLAACAVEGKSPRTVDAYAETLRRFQAVCVAEGLPDDVAAFRPAHVYAFLKIIADSGVSSAPGTAASAKPGPSSPGASAWAPARGTPSQAFPTSRWSRK